MKDFKSMVRTFAARELHRPFEISLKKIDPALDLSYAKNADSKVFIYGGRGCGTLKPYRVLTKGTTKTFEKIFFNDSNELKANLAFYENENKLIKGTKIKVPKFQDIIKGDIFSICLCECVELKPLSTGKEYKKLKKKTLELYHSSPYRDLADPFTFNKYQWGKKRLLACNIMTESEFSLIDHKIEQAPVCFQHLDLSENNVFKKHIVIDWDNSGFYPLGMDFGRLLLSYFKFHEDKFCKRYKDKIDEYYQYLHHEISLQDFQILIIYFFIIFYYGESSCPDQQNKIQPIIAEFKIILSTISWQYCIRTEGDK